MTVIAAFKTSRCSTFIVVLIRKRYELGTLFPILGVASSGRIFFFWTNSFPNLFSVFNFYCRFNIKTIRCVHFYSNPRGWLVQAWFSSSGQMFFPTLSVLSFYCRFNTRYDFDTCFPILGCVWLVQAWFPSSGQICFFPPTFFKTK